MGVHGTIGTHSHSKIQRREGNGYGQVAVLVLSGTFSDFIWNMVVDKKYDDVKKLGALIAPSFYIVIFPFPIGSISFLLPPQSRL